MYSLVSIVNGQIEAVVVIRVSQTHVGVPREQQVDALHVTARTREMQRGGLMGDNIKHSV